MKSNIVQSYLWVVPFSVLILSGNALPKPHPEPSPSPSPQYQYPPPPRSSQSSQQFTVYKPIQVGYPSSGTSTAGVRKDAYGNPLHPIFTYNYNISHPPKSGVPGAQSQIQFSNQQQRQLLYSTPGQRQGTPLELQYQRQFQRNQNYAPVIISNPNFNHQYYPGQSSVSGTGSFGSAQFYANSEVDREPEEDDISFRSNSKNRKGNTIVFGQRIPSQQFLNQLQRNPDSIVFANGQPDTRSRAYNFYSGPGTTPPPIQVPYITTPSALQAIKKLNSQQTLAGYRTHFVNPLTFQNQFGRNTASTAPFNLNYNPNTALRTGRVQNIVVPISNTAQTPAGTRLLQQNFNGLEQLQNSVAQTVFNHQNGGQIFPGQNPTVGVDLSSPNLHILKGLAITPENQRDVGHIIFNDPINPPIPSGNAVFAGSAKKVFILPQGDGLSSTDSENTANQAEDTPSEIVVTVVDESVDGDKNETGKVLSNFSLFLLPSTYKKCVSGYRRAHDGKCRLIIKLRGRTRNL